MADGPRTLSRSSNQYPLDSEPAATLPIQTLFGFEIQNVEAAPSVSPEITPDAGVLSVCAPMLFRNLVCSS
eukprot:1930068-Rhodomonas_salina.1